MSHVMSTGVSGGIHGYCSSVGGATTPLALLETIDRVVDALARDQKIVCGLSQVGESLRESVRGFTGPDQFDPEDEMVLLLEEAEKKIEATVEGLRPRLESAYRDPELNGDHEDVVVSEFKNLIECYCTLYAVTRDLRWEIMEHDADRDKVEPGVFTNAEDLIASLNQ